MLNILLLEIFSIFPSVGVVVCFGFGFFGPFYLRFFFWFPSCILPVYPLGSFFFLLLVLIQLLIYQKKKNFVSIRNSSRLGDVRECCAKGVFKFLKLKILHVSIKY